MGKVMAAIEMVRFPWPEFKLFGDHAKITFFESKILCYCLWYNFRNLKFSVAVSATESRSGKVLVFDFQ